MIVVNKCLVRTSDNTENIYLVRGKTTIGARVKTKLEIGWVYGDVVKIIKSYSEDLKGSEMIESERDIWLYTNIIKELQNQVKKARRKKNDKK